MVVENLVSVCSSAAVEMIVMTCFSHNRNLCSLKDFLISIVSTRSPKSIVLWASNRPANYGLPRRGRIEDSRNLT
jgi:hypothetical protein